MFSSCACVIVKVRICKHACFHQNFGKLDGKNSQFKKAFQKAFYNLRVCCKTNRKNAQDFV